MAEELPERDQKLVSRLRSTAAASFRFRRIVGIVLLVLAFVPLGLMVLVVTVASGREGPTQVAFLCWLALVLFMAADIVGERARLHGIIHHLAEKGGSVEST